MTKMVHTATKEVVFVIGYYVNSKGTLMAKCLGDARLHPYDKGKLIAGSIMLTLTAEVLIPMDAVDWDSVNADTYPEGFYDKLYQSRFDERRKSLECSAIARYKQEYASCIKNGIPEDEAVRIAEETKAHFIEEKMKIPSKEETKAMRTLKW